MNNRTLWRRISMVCVVLLVIGIFHPQTVQNVIPCEWYGVSPVPQLNTNMGKFINVSDNIRVEVVDGRKGTVVTSSLPEKDRWKVMVTVSAGFHDMFENWLLYYKNLSLPLRLVIIAEDDSTYSRYANRPDFVVEKPPSYIKTQNSLSYESKAYKQLVSKRGSHLLKFLKTGEPVLYSDIDTVWLADPRDFLVGDYDMWITLDTNTVVCTGFMAFKPNERTITFLEKWDKALQRPQLNQPVFNSLLNKSDVKCKRLPRKEFPSGDLYFGKNKTEGAIIVHNNWIIGHDKKVNRFKKMNLWKV